MKHSLTLARACGAGLLLVFALVPAKQTRGAVVHDESSMGELSGAFGAPSSLNIMPGVNTIIGQIGATGATGATNGLDADYFTFSLGPNQTVDSFTIDSYLLNGVAATDRAFAGYTNASAFNGQGFGDVFAGGELFASGAGNILPALAGGDLGPGDHSFWLQQTTGSVFDYQVSFNVVTAVPEPSSVLAMTLIGGITGVRHYRRRSKKANQPRK